MQRRRSNLTSRRQQCAKRWRHSAVQSGSQMRVFIAYKCPDLNHHLPLQGCTSSGSYRNRRSSAVAARCRSARQQMLKRRVLTSPSVYNALYTFHLDVPPLPVEVHWKEQARADNRMNVDAHPRPELLISSSLCESKCFRTADTTLIARLCWASSAIACPVCCRPPLPLRWNPSLKPLRALAPRLVHTAHTPATRRGDA